MLAHRLRRWPNTKPALPQRLVFTGTHSNTVTSLWQTKLAGQAEVDGVYLDFFKSRSVINIIYTLDHCICPDN